MANNSVGVEHLEAGAETEAPTPAPEVAVRAAGQDCVSARASLDTTDVAVAEALIGNIVRAAVETIGRFLPAIDAVAAGEVEPADLREPTDQAPTHNLDQTTPDEIASFMSEHFDGG